MLVFAEHLMVFYGIRFRAVARISKRATASLAIFSTRGAFREIRDDGMLNFN
jgi:hypothetical protein